MKVLVDLSKIPDYEIVKDIEEIIYVETTLGNASLKIIATSSSQELVIAVLVGTEWKTMHILSPLLYKGIEVFAESWEEA